MTENPGTKKVRRLLRKVDEGSYVIPHFQRGFGWQPSMVCDLLESILQEYYTGLILLWELKPEEARKHQWEPVWGTEKRNTPEEAILDGQQRLASLYYAIYNPNEKFPNRKSFYVFFINLNKVLKKDFEGSVTYRYFSSHKSWEELKGYMDAAKGTVPLPILVAKDTNDSETDFLESSEFENWVNEYKEWNRSEFFENITPIKVARVLRKILNYSFIHFTLSRERELPDICNIFARVNAKGMKLSTFDLMNAFLYPKGIELRKGLWEDLDNETLKRIDPKINEYILKIISLKKQDYCSSKFLYNLIPEEKTMKRDEQGKRYEEVLVESPDDFERLWWKACHYAEKARSMIMNTGAWDFGAIKRDFIPNTTIIPVLGAILWQSQGDNQSDFKDNLKKWYWSAVLSEEYSGSSDSVMAKDFRNWKKWMNNGEDIERISRIDQDFIQGLDLKNVKRGSARYKAIISILALNGPRDFYNGRRVGTGDYSEEKINDHHIFPKGAEGLEQENEEFRKSKDAVANKTLLFDETNNKIRKKRPSKYIEKMVQKHGSEEQVKYILKRHLINDRAFEHMKEDNFDKFIEEREKTIKNHLISELSI